MSALTFSAVPASACETVSEGRVETAWTIRLADDAWLARLDCDAALDEIAGLIAANRRRRVSIQSILSGRAPTSIVLAQLAATASRIEQGLIARGVARGRIKMHEFRFPARDAAEAAAESRVIIRVRDQ